MYWTVSSHCRCQAFRLQKFYPVQIEAQTLGGVRTEVFTPKDGIAAKNKQRVLIDLRCSTSSNMRALALYLRHWNEFGADIVRAGSQS